MDYENIKIILERYWRCETSLEEESQLREYFEGDNIPEDLKSIAPLFRCYKNISELKPQLEFKIENLTPGKDVHSTRGRFLAILPQWYYRAAAVILILLSVFIIHERMSKVSTTAIALSKDTFKNPEAALQETKRVLMMVSIEMQKGEKQAGKFAEFNKAENTYKKNDE